MAARLRDGRQEEGVVELPIAAPVEPHAVDLARAGRDGSHPRQQGEGVGRVEAAHIAGAADQLGRRQRPDTRQSQQGVLPDQ